MARATEQGKISATPSSTPGNAPIVTDTTTPISPTGTGLVNKDQVIGAVNKLKLTESQSNAVSYALRMMESNKAINNQLAAGYDPTNTVSAVGRLFASDNARTLDRDMQNFIRAQLRKESGAQISDSELSGGKKIYDPSGVLTNSKDIDQTNATRQQAIQSMIAQAGPAGSVLNDYFKSIGTGGKDPVNQMEDDAKTKLIKTGKTNPDAASQISTVLSKTNPDTGQPYTYSEAAQILGIQ
jgi:hypothetical protein